jgi:hypothetical protein
LPFQGCILDVVTKLKKNSSCRDHICPFVIQYQQINIRANLFLNPKMNMSPEVVWKFRFFKRFIARKLEYTLVQKVTKLFP